MYISYKDLLTLHENFVKMLYQNVWAILMFALKKRRKRLD